MTLLPEWVPNLHPLIVHFPIALWIAAAAVDVLALAFPRAFWADTTAAVLYPAGAVTAAIAYLTGRRAAATVLIPGMGQAIMQEHWNWALATVISFAAVAAARLWIVFRHTELPRVARAAIVIAGLVALVALFETGERGARLVFQYGVGVAAPGLPQ